MKPTRSLNDPTTQTLKRDIQNLAAAEADMFLRDWPDGADKERVFALRDSVVDRLVELLQPLIECGNLHIQLEDGIRDAMFEASIAYNNGALVLCGRESDLVLCKGPSEFSNN